MSRILACLPLQVLAVKGDMARIGLTQPVCTQEDEKIALSRRVEKHWRCVQCRGVCRIVLLRQHYCVLWLSELKSCR